MIQKTETIKITEDVNDELPEIKATENQRKVIKDKYLRDAPSLEHWLKGVALNIALGEILYSGIPEKEIFKGVKYESKEYDDGNGNITIVHHLHANHESMSLQKKNFRKFMKNLYDIAETNPQAKAAVQKAFVKFYKMMASWKFLPNSPTLMNAGRDLQQLSACYVLPVNDSIEGIYKSVRDMAFIHQSGGGTGFDFSRLRPSGSPVQSTKGVSSGPCTFMQLFDKSTDVVKQGGTRRGANMGILRYDHPDVEHFIEMKKTPGVMENFNVSITITEDFMKKVESGEDYDLIDPNTKEVSGQLNAKKLWDRLVHGAWETGDPGIIFIDRINNSPSNPTPAQGMIESTNPCVTGDMRVATEQGLIKIKDLVGSTPKIYTDARVPINIETSSGIMVAYQMTDQLHEVLEVFPTGEKEVFEITTKNGYTIKATPNHKIMTDRGWVPLEELKIGEDEVLIQSNGVFSTDKTLPFTVQNTHIGANGKTYETNFPTEWSEDLGFALGWLIGDGWLRSKDKNCRVGWTFNSDEIDAMKRVQSFTNAIYGQSVSPVLRENGVYHLSYHSKYFVEYFKQFGVGDWKSATKRVPESIFTAPREVVASFLRGLFGADGTIMKHNSKSSSDQVRLISKSKELLKDSQLLLLQFGIKSSVMDRSRAPKKNMFTYTPKYGEKHSYDVDGELYELHITGHNIEEFRKIGFGTPKKSFALHKAEHGHRKVEFKALVTEITSLGKEQVYDLTELTTHSMICHGVLVHNCGEQPLLPYEPCNLGSINLSKFIEDDGSDFDWESLKETVHTTIHFLDNVVTVNNYPLPEIEEIAKRNRRVGLGVMGWAESLVKLGLSYNSDEAFDMAKKLMKFINDESMVASEELAKTRGVFGGFKDSIYDKNGEHFSGDAHRPRNSARTTIAPTGTIGIASGLQGAGIEPFFAIVYTRYNAKALDALKKGETPDPNDTFWEVNPLFEEIAEKNDYFGYGKEELYKLIDGNHKSLVGIEGIPKKIQDLFLTSHDLSPLDHVRVQCAFQEHTDNAVSKTVNLKNDATPKDIEEVYQLAYKLGAKGVTVYRDGCKDFQVLNLGDKKGKEEEEEKAPDRGTLAEYSDYYSIETGSGNLHIHINYDELGPRRIFGNLAPLGTEISGLTSALCIMLSKYLEQGGDPVRILKHLNSIKSDRPYGFGQKRVDSIPHAISKALRANLVKTGFFTDETGQTSLASPKQVPNGGHDSIEKTVSSKDVDERLYCPQCYSTNVQMMAGCSEPTCFDCGYSKCS